MSILNGKNILLGISGGIAAYKSPFLVRLLIKSGANVQVIMTPSSKDFVTPLTLSTLSNNPVLSDFFSKDNLHLRGAIGHRACRLFLAFISFSLFCKTKIYHYAKDISYQILQSFYLRLSGKYSSNIRQILP